MAWITILLAVTGMSVLFVLAGRRPLTLEGRKRKWFLLGAAAVNLLAAAALLLGEGNVPWQISRFYLINGMYLAAATDLLEKSVYELHYRLLLLGGAISAFLQEGTTFFAMYLTFGVLYGLLFLVSRRNGQLGMGDSQMIACLALYFPLPRWTEVVLLALLGAMLCGLAGIAMKKKTIKSELPFIPFLLGGTIIEYFL